MWELNTTACQDASTTSQATGGARTKSSVASKLNCLFFPFSCLISSLNLFFTPHLTREYKRMNDEYADRIADNRHSIDNSRDWLTTDGGVIDRVHRMSAQTVS